MKDLDGNDSRKYFYHKLILVDRVDQPSLDG